jgi:uncharacterized membrane protein (DUF373 family)
LGQIMDKHTTENKDFIAKIIPYLKQVANIIIVILMLALIVTIVYKLYILFFVDIAIGNFDGIINDLLLTLIFIELFTILYSYLEKHYIKVERVIELGIISVVREIIFKVNEIQANKIYAIAVLLVSFGLIFYIEKYWSKTRNQ